MAGPPLPKPSSLSKTLSHLTRTPHPILPTSLRALNLTLAARNAHFGARHFLKDDLPRIAYHNPGLAITVERKVHLKEEPWKPVLEAEFADGWKGEIDMTQKHSSAILQELLALSERRANETAVLPPS